MGNKQLAVTSSFDTCMDKCPDEIRRIIAEFVGMQYISIIKSIGCVNVPRHISWITTRHIMRIHYELFKIFDKCREIAVVEFILKCNDPLCDTVLRTEFVEWLIYTADILDLRQSARADRHVFRDNIIIATRSLVKLSRDQESPRILSVIAAGAKMLARLFEECKPWF